MSRYSEPEPGEWVRPKPTGYKLACCDCGLVHLYDFRVEDGHVEFRVFPARRETGQVRRHMGGVRLVAELQAATPPAGSTIPDRPLDVGSEAGQELLADIAVMALGEVTTGAAYGLYHKSFREHFVARLTRVERG